MLLKLKVTTSNPICVHNYPSRRINIKSIDKPNESGMKLETEEGRRCKCSVDGYVEFRKGDAGSLSRRMPIDSSLAYLEITLPFLF